MIKPGGCGPTKKRGVTPKNRSRDAGTAEELGGMIKNERGEACIRLGKEMTRGGKNVESCWGWRRGGLTSGKTIGGGWDHLRRRGAGGGTKGRKRLGVRRTETLLRGWEDGTKEFCVRENPPGAIKGGRSNKLVHWGASSKLEKLSKVQLARFKDLTTEKAQLQEEHAFGSTR